MPRPYRPNPSPLPRLLDNRHKRKLTHVKQETGPERRERLRLEAEARNAPLEEKPTKKPTWRSRKPRKKRS